MRDKDIRLAGKAANLILQELKENSYRQLNIAFASLTIIPFLAFVYLIFARLSIKNIPLGEVGLILSSIIVIALCGVYLGYKIIQDILDRIIFYAAQAKQNEYHKSAFVATVSHELKAPLTILKTNFFNIVSGILGQINQEQKKALGYCDNAIDQMDNRINGLLNLYKLESGGLESSRKFCDLKEIVQQEIRKFDILFNQKKIRLQEEYQKEALSVWADESNLKSIINNLLSNAIKFTPEGGGVLFRVFAEHGGLRLECSDTGPGIPADKINRIFNKFETLDITKEGTGLGLFITKQIVEMLKGKIWVENQPGQGAKFIVILPCDSRKIRENSYGRKGR